VCCRETRKKDQRREKRERSRERETMSVCDCRTERERERERENKQIAERERRDERSCPVLIRTEFCLVTHPPNTTTPNSKTGLQKDKRKNENGNFRIVHHSQPITTSHHPCVLYKENEKKKGGNRKNERTGRNKQKITNNKGNENRTSREGNCYLTIHGCPPQKSAALDVRETSVVDHEKGRREQRGEGGGGN